MNSMIRWLTEHPLAVNLTAVLVVALGALTALQLPQKTFPEFTLDVVSISVSYPGATAAEIEDSMVRPIEDQLSGIDGIDSITANIAEGRGGIAITFLAGVDRLEKLEEVKTAVERITVFPEDASDPTVVLADNSARVMEIVVHGNVDERILKETAQRLRDDLQLLDEISFVEVRNVRDYEVRIEINRDTLRAYGLTLDDVARVVRENSLELPGGSIETDTIAIPLRTAGRNFTQADFEKIVIRAGDDGAKVLLRDVATVSDGFEDTDLSATFAGDRAVSVNVFRVGDEQVIKIVAQASAFLDKTFRPSLPEGINVSIWENAAESLQSRLDLLVENAVVGLALVVLCLALFLDLRLAMWAAVGIGISFAGTFIVMGFMDLSINQISLFGFILAVGIVVDNAIVVGEQIYTNGSKGMTRMEAAIRAAQRIAIPVIFSTLTTIVAFWPLLELPGTLGKFLADIPIVVMIVLTLSMFQALLMLPRNLSLHDFSSDHKPNIVLRAANLIRGFVDVGMQWFIRVPLDAVLRITTAGFALLIPIAGAIAMIVMSVGLLAFGYVRFEFFPSIESDRVTVVIEMNDGTTFALTEAVAETVRRAALVAGEEVQASLPEGAPPVIVGVNVVVGQGLAGGGPNTGPAASGTTLANVVVRLTDPEQRDWPSSLYETAWRRAIGNIAGVNQLTVSASLVGAGDPVSVELSLPDGQDIVPVVTELRAALAEIQGVFGLRDDNSAGQLEYKLVLKEDARVYGVTLQNLAEQTRAGFFGIEATKVQRGADNVAVVVRFPKDERNSLSDLLDTQISTPQGDLIPLGKVATVQEAVAATQILRRDGRQITTVTSDLDTDVATSGQVNATIVADILPGLVSKYPGLIVELGGEQREQGDAQAALGSALGIALFVIYALLALVFRSYIQPIVVMFAIPLGLVGAIAGHYIIGIPLTILSIFGIIGLAGVVINNSLVMVDVYNEHIGNGIGVREAVIRGTKERFRPIFLTSLTTFLGVYPLTMETSLQAQFLIPLAVSIGYGVLFGTVLIVLCVPALFLAQHYIFSAFGSVFSTFAGTQAPKQPISSAPEQ
jgi:multidrug efflux pump subunit AcrB